MQVFIAELSPTALFQSNDVAAMQRWTGQLVWVSTDGPVALMGPALVEQLELLPQAAAVGGAARLWRCLPACLCHQRRHWRWHWVPL